VPSSVRHIESIPLNANGKVNRKELAELLSGGKL
jgi:acyl-CoA synthetase (AMP-forming)/AMP-acid ligase II